ncbi:MAG: hypothetical protein PHO41_08230 [Eubacteriales bacterium]|nr:hypothetical protein [Eubacteriales bacterium]
MRKERLLLLLLAIWLLTACTAPVAEPEATPEAAADAPAVTAEPTMIPSPTLTPAPIEELPPENERQYYNSGYPARSLNGGSYTADDLKLLALRLREKDWERLSEVLEVFGTRMDTFAPGADILWSEVLANSYDTEGYDVTFPIADEDSGIVYIRLHPASVREGWEYLIVFERKTAGRGSGLSSLAEKGETLYAPRCVISYYADYYDSDGDYILRFVKLGSQTYAIWNGLVGHGTGYEAFGRKWFSLINGQDVFAYDKWGGESTSRNGGWVTENWDNHVSYEAVPIGDAGDFYLEATAKREFSVEDTVQPESYTCRYRVYYSAEKWAFYTAIDALLPLYEQAKTSNEPYVAQWAEGRIADINEARAVVKAG